MIRLEKKDSELTRLLKQLSAQERTVRNAFLSFINVVTSDEVFKEINNFLRAGNIEGALNVVDSYIVRVSDVLTRVFIDVGDVETAALTQSLGIAAVGISFDPTDSTTVEIMRTNKLSFIQNITEQQRIATRQALVRAFTLGEGPRKTALAFKNSIGLTGKQEQAIENYKRLLKTNSTQALTRELRDRRFDPSIRRAIELDDLLTNNQIDKMVARYRARMLQFRAENVARTEGVRAVSSARDLALRQMLEVTGMPETRVIRIWNRVPDDRTRDEHNKMQGQKVGLNEVFIDSAGNILRFPGDPRAPLSTTANCRCIIIIQFKSA